MKYIICFIIFCNSFVQAIGLQQSAFDSKSPIRNHQASSVRKSFYAQQAADSIRNDLQKTVHAVEVLKEGIKTLEEQEAFADTRISDFLNELSNLDGDKKTSLRLLKYALEQKKSLSGHRSLLQKELFLAQQKEFYLQEKMIQATARVRSLSPIKG